MNVFGWLFGRSLGSDTGHMKADAEAELHQVRRATPRFEVLADHVRDVSNDEWARRVHRAFGPRQ